jgi:septal ring factor EnvC (AmiA/AmiB activator)
LQTDCLYENNFGLKLTGKNMTENQEKEVFLLLNTIVTQVQGVQSGVQVLTRDVQEIKQTLDEHSQILKRLDAKTDSIAETFMSHENRLIKAEKNIEDLQGRVH